MGGSVAALAAIEPGPRGFAGEMPDRWFLSAFAPSVCRIAGLPPRALQDTDADPIRPRPVSELPGLSRPLLAFADLAHFEAPTFIVVTVVPTAVAALIVTRPRGRAAVLASVPGSGLSREEALGHVRRVKSQMKGRKGEAAVADVLARAELPALHDVVLRDSRGLTQIDHLVRLADGIAVLETKAFGRTVTGRVNDRQWVQHWREGQVRTVFADPLLQNHRHVQAVRELVGAGVAVAGLVGLAGPARFSGELEHAVVRLDELATRLCRMRATIGTCDPARLDAAWRVLTVAATRSSELRQAHGEQVQRRRGDVR